MIHAMNGNFHGEVQEEQTPFFTQVQQQLNVMTPKDKAGMAGMRY